MAPQNSSWIELSISAVRHNLAVFRSLIDGTADDAVATKTADRPRLGIVLKGNAYGHGFAHMLPLVHAGADRIYVIEPEDALAIRSFEIQTGAPHKDVLVIGSIGADEAVALAKAGVTMAVGDSSWKENAAALRAANLGTKAVVHVHLDTGLSREGFGPGAIEEGFGFLKEASDVLEVRGVFSHFANTEDVTEQAYADFQLRNFSKGVEELRATLGLAGPLEEHLAASAASLVLPPARLSCMRVGIALYGLWPSTETRLSTRILFPQPPALKPVLSWRCRSQLVKTLSPGTFVGYGCTWRAEQATRVAVLPVGYFDGIPRLVASKAYVLVNGHRAPVIGRIMMNHIVVDVTRAASDDSPVVATLLGTDGNETVSVDMMAGWAQTINYEIVTRLGSHLRRSVVE